MRLRLMSKAARKPKLRTIAFRRMRWLNRKRDERQVWQAIGKLDEKHREVIILRHFQNMSYDQMAEGLFCNKGTVTSRLYYARKQLEELLSIRDPAFVTRGIAVIFARESGGDALEMSTIDEPRETNSEKGGLPYDMS